MLKLPDKNTSWNYQYGSLPVDLSSIIQEVNSFENEWLLDTSRQDKLATHKDTKMFQLRFMSYHWEIGQGNTSYDINYFKNKQSNESLNAIYEYLENLYDGKVIRSEIIQMNKRSGIKSHVDGGVMLQLGRRIHIPLITNPKVIFEVFEEKKYLEVGNWYEINNIIPHSVINDSDHDRIHAIIDIMPNKYLGAKNA
jgi:hypothetical protein